MMEYGRKTGRNVFQYQYDEFTLLILEFVSVISAVLIMYTIVYFIANRTIRSERNLFNLNIVFSDFLKIAFCTIPTMVLATDQGALGFYRYCKIFGFLSVFLRNVTWFTVAVLTYARFRQVLNFNPTGDLRSRFTLGASFLIWSFSFMIALFGFLFGAYVEHDNSSCVIVWFNSTTDSKRYAVFVTVVIAFALIFIVYTLLVTRSTRMIYTEHTSQDNSDMKLVLIVILLIGSHLPFMIVQLTYTLTKDTLFNPKSIIVGAYILTTFGQVLHPFLLWYYSGSINPIRACRAIRRVINGMPPDNASYRSLEVIVPPTGCMRKFYKYFAMNPGRLNNAPAAVEEFGMGPIEAQPHPQIIQVQPAAADSCEPSRSELATSAM